MQCTWVIQKPTIIRRKTTIKTLDCNPYLPSRTEIYWLFFCCCSSQRSSGIAAFHHIIQEPRTRNIPLIQVTPGLKQPKEVLGKEIQVAALKALSSISPVIKSEDLQSLVHEITSIRRSKNLNIDVGRKDETHGEWVASKVAESFQTLQNEL